MAKGQINSRALRRHLLVGVVYLLVFLLLTSYTSTYFSIATGVMVVYLPAGLNLALLLRYGPSYAVAVFFAGLLGGVLILVPDAPLASLIIVAATTPLVEASWAWLLRKVTPANWGLWRLREMALFALQQERDDGVAQEHHWLIAPYLGLSATRGRWQFQVEARVYTPNLNSEYGRCVENLGFGDHGILGVFLGIGRTFGASRD
jgi:hypothetical protein